MISYFTSFVKSNNNSNILDTREDDDSLLIEEEDDPTVVKETKNSLYDLIDEDYFLTDEYINHITMIDPKKKKEMEEKIKGIIMEIAMIDYVSCTESDIFYSGFLNNFIKESIAKYLHITISCGSIYCAYKTIKKLFALKVEEIILNNRDLICKPNLKHKEYAISKETYDKIFKTIDESDDALERKALLKDPSINKSKFKISASKKLKQTMEELKLLDKYDMFQKLVSNFEKGEGIEKKHSQLTKVKNYAIEMFPKLFRGKKLY